jgi:ribosomal protein S30
MITTQIQHVQAEIRSLVTRSNLEDRFAIHLVVSAEGLENYCSLSQAEAVVEIYDLFRRMFQRIKTNCDGVASYIAELAFSARCIPHIHAVISTPLPLEQIFQQPDSAGKIRDVSPKFINKRYRVWPRYEATRGAQYRRRIISYQSSRIGGAALFYLCQHESLSTILDYQLRADDKSQNFDPISAMDAGRMVFTTSQDLPGYRNVYRAIKSLYVFLECARSSYKENYSLISSQDTRRDPAEFQKAITDRLRNLIRKAIFQARNLSAE